MTNTLRVRRAERRLSQRRIAQAAGIGFDRYWRIESGYTDPTAVEQEALARALGCDQSQLFPASSEAVA